MPHEINFSSILYFSNFIHYFSHIFIEILMPKEQTEK